MLPSTNRWKNKSLLMSIIVICTVVLVLVSRNTSPTVIEKHGSNAISTTSITTTHTTLAKTDMLYNTGEYQIQNEANPNKATSESYRKLFATDKTPNNNESNMSDITQTQQLFDAENETSKTTPMQLMIDVLDEVNNTTSLSSPVSCDMTAINKNDTDSTRLHSCQFPLISYEKGLEDRISNLDQIDLPFLDNYHNPCWYESLPSGHSENLMYRVEQQIFEDQANLSFNTMKPIMQDRIASGHPWRLRCLPLVYVLGVAKCGTTDLWVWLVNHPQIVAPATKEPLFWSNSRWAKYGTLYDYLDLYDEAASIIRQDTSTQLYGNDSGVYHRKVTIDMSVSTLFLFSGTKQYYHDNDIKDGPRHIAADLIKNLTPQAKMIVLLRNPTDRLYSEYKFFSAVLLHRKFSVYEFHSLATEAVGRMNKCLGKGSLRYCVYEHRYTKHNKWVRLVAGMYAPFIRDWLNVFPDMKIYRTEDYHENRKAVVIDILRFIGVDVIIPDTVDTRIRNEGPPGDAMLNKTRHMLDTFYQPFNEQLANLLNDKRYLFKK